MAISNNTYQAIELLNKVHTIPVLPDKYNFNTKLFAIIQHLL